MNDEMPTQQSPSKQKEASAKGQKQTQKQIQKAKTTATEKRTDITSALTKAS